MLKCTEENLCTVICKTRISSKLMINSNFKDITSLNKKK